MTDQDPTKYVVPTETEPTHDQDPMTDLKAVSARIDELLASDTEGKLKVSARDPYPNSPERAKIGERFNENVSRTTKQDGSMLYHVAYSTEVEPRQPDSSKPYYSPYSSEPTYFDWQVNEGGEISNFAKNAQPATDEERAALVAEVERTLSEGLDKGTLTADQYTGVEHNQPSRPKNLMGRLAAMVGVGRKQ